MKKIIVTLIAIFFLFITYNYSYAEYMNYKDWRTGEQNYYDINNYSELFSLFEDLNYDYDKLTEEYHSLNRIVEEKYEKIEELQKQLDNKKQENNSSLNTSKWLIILMLFGVPLLIYICNKK